MSVLTHARPRRLTLEPDELFDLTGYRQAKRQTDWLDSRGWIYEAPEKRGERPKVDRAYYLARMSGTPHAASRSAPRAEPKLAWLLRGNQS